jgi:hypothetical protein
MSENAASPIVLLLQRYDVKAFNLGQKLSQSEWNVLSNKLSDAINNSMSIKRGEKSVTTLQA